MGRQKRQRALSDSGTDTHLMAPVESVTLTVTDWPEARSTSLLNANGQTGNMKSFDTNAPCVRSAGLLGQVLECCGAGLTTYTELATDVSAGTSVKWHVRQ